MADRERGGQNVVVNSGLPPNVHCEGMIAVKRSSLVLLILVIAVLSLGSRFSPRSQRLTAAEDAVSQISKPLVLQTRSRVTQKPDGGVAKVEVVRGDSR